MKANRKIIFSTTKERERERERDGEGGKGEKSEMFLLDSIS